MTVHSIGRAERVVPVSDAPVVVINPNSTQSVTDGIRDAIELLPQSGDRAIEYLTLAEGPPAIETDAQVTAVAIPLLKLAGSRDDASALVVACFSDPGLALLRQSVSVPVFGIGESAYREAAANGRRFGVVSILSVSVPRHARYIEELGLSGQLAGDRALELGVLQLADDALTWNRLCAVSRELIDEDEAQVLVLGCAGMARYRERLTREMGVEVIDPSQAAALCAFAAAR